MAVSIPPTAADVHDSDPSSVVFVGGLDYFPNEVAVRWFADRVATRMGAPPEFRLSVVGACPDNLRERLESPAIQFLGYVDDAVAELRRHRAFVAPMVEGTGVKTKVLEAMAVGLPVVTTSAGVRGLSLEHGVQCLIADTGDEFLRCLELVARDPELAVRIGAAGREYVRRHFSPDEIVGRWAHLLATVRGEADAALPSAASAEAVRVRAVSGFESRP
jgi:glycosyltransferase involved in cell wall biosynthesis